MLGRCNPRQHSMLTSLSCDDVIGWQASPSDAEQIYSAIYSRAQKLKSAATAAVTKPSSLVSKDAPSLTASPVSSVSAAEKRPNEEIAYSDPAVADKRRRLPFQCLLCSVFILRLWFLMRCIVQFSPYLFGSAHFSHWCGNYRTCGF